MDSDGSIPNGASNPTLTVTPAADAVTLGTHTSGNYVAQGAVAGNGPKWSPRCRRCNILSYIQCNYSGNSKHYCIPWWSRELACVGLNAGFVQFLTSNYVGRDANDYIAWANDSHTVAVVARTERLRVNTSGIDVPW